MTNLNAILNQVTVCRAHADRLTHDGLLTWLTMGGFCKPINLAARWCISEPKNSEASRWLLLNLMRQIRRRFRGETYYLGHEDLHELRGCFRAVARTYLKQRRAERLSAAAE